MRWFCIYIYINCAWTQTRLNGCCAAFILLVLDRSSVYLLLRALLLLFFFQFIVSVCSHWWWVFCGYCCFHLLSGVFCFSERFFSALQPQFDVTPQSMKRLNWHECLNVANHWQNCVWRDFHAHTYTPTIAAFWNEKKSV